MVSTSDEEKRSRQEAEEQPSATHNQQCLLQSTPTVAKLLRLSIKIGKTQRRSDSEFSGVCAEMGGWFR